MQKINRDKAQMFTVQSYGSLMLRWFLGKEFGGAAASIKPICKQFSPFFFFFGKSKNPLLTEKKIHNLKVENYVLFGGCSEDLSSEDNLLDHSEGLL